MSTRFYYLRDTKNIQQLRDGRLSRGNPRVCIASSIDRDKNIIRYAFSVAHKADTFTKSRAKSIATGRLETCPYVIVLKQELPCSSHEISKMVMQNIVDNEFKQTQTIVNGLFSTRKVQNFPSTIVKFAKAWLEFAKLPRKTIPCPPPIVCITASSVPRGCQPPAAT